MTTERGRSPVGEVAACRLAWVPRRWAGLQRTPTSSNGRTSACGAENAGSSPAVATIIVLALLLGGCSPVDLVMIGVALAVDVVQKCQEQPWKCEADDGGDTVYPAHR